VDLTLTGDSDSQLHALTERIREETFPGYKGWYRLGQFMIKVGQFNKAEELYEMLFKQTTNEDEKALLFYQFGHIKDNQGNYAEAIGFYEKAIRIYNIPPTNVHELANSYNNIGLVYEKIGEYSKAILSYEKALEI